MVFPGAPGAGCFGSSVAAEAQFLNPAVCKVLSLAYPSTPSPARLDKGPRYEVSPVPTREPAGGQIL